MDDAPKDYIERAFLNPPNPWDGTHVEWLEEIPRQRIQLFRDSTKTILSENRSPDLPFRWSVNPYRGCTHACAYCYARTTHEYLGRGAGSDFDTQIFVKSEAPRLLRAALSKERWIGERIVFSGVTDPYQPVEASFGLTRGCLEVCEEAANPVTIVTKGALVERDVELLASIHRRSDALVVVSLPFLNGEVARKIEPGVPSPRRRLAVIERLSSAGIPVSVAISPIIPGLNDMEIPGILRAARRAGARFAHHSLVRLQGNVERVFRQRLHESFPKRKERVLHQIASCRNGERETREFHSRMKGRGERWQIVTALFAQTKRRLAFEEWKGPMQSSAFRRPRMDGQLSLL